MKKNLSANIVNLILVIAGVGLFISAQGIQTGNAMAQGSDFMPKLMTSIWMILSVILLLSGFRDSDAKEPGKMDLKRFFATLGLLFCYIFLLNQIGFVIASILYCFIQMLLFSPPESKNKKNYIKFAVISIVCPIAVNLIFANMFYLILPQGNLIPF